MKRTRWVLTGILCLAAGANAAGKDVTQSPSSNTTEWPSAVSDSEPHGLLLFELFEYNPRAGGSLRWDIVGWRGGDYDRIWFKSEGTQSSTLSTGGVGDLQVLYGRMISAYFDFQVGLDYNRAWGRANQAGRFQLVLGLQGLVPYSFQLEPVVFISQNGEISGRITASQDFVLSQRFIANFRFETSAAAQHAHAFDVGSGFNDISVGLRFRYELRREFAPYLGVNWNHLFGETADYARRSGTSPEGFALIGGIRAWL